MTLIAFTHVLLFLAPPQALSMCKVGGSADVAVVATVERLDPYLTTALPGAVPCYVSHPAVATLRVDTAIVGTAEAPCLVYASPQCAADTTRLEVGDVGVFLLVRSGASVSGKTLFTIAGLGRGFLPVDASDRTRFRVPRGAYVPKPLVRAGYDKSTLAVVDIQRLIEKCKASPQTSGAILCEQKPVRAFLHPDTNDVATVTVYTESDVLGPAAFYRNQLECAIWADGRMLWSDGGVFHAARVDPSTVAELVADIAQTFGDDPRALWTYGPHASYTAVVVAGNGIVLEVRRDTTSPVTERTENAVSRWKHVIQLIEDVQKHASGNQPAAAPQSEYCTVH